ncbi:MAG: hypothetical protein ACREQ9_23770, partial [Candidatus Binatia bacterium]
LAAGEVARGGKAAPLHAAACGAALGVGFGIKYQALVGVVVPALAGSRLWRDGRRGALAACAAVFSVAWVGGVFLSSPLLPEHTAYFLEEFPRFMRWQTNITGRDLPLGEKAGRNVLWLVRFLAAGWMWVLLPGSGGRYPGSPAAQLPLASRCGSPPRSVSSSRSSLYSWSLATSSARTTCSRCSRS